MVGHVFSFRIARILIGLIGLSCELRDALSRPGEVTTLRSQLPKPLHMRAWARPGA